MDGINAENFDYTYKGKLLRHVDADTQDVLVDLGFNVSMTVRVRLSQFGGYDYDAPETFRPRSEAERAHGKQAVEFAKHVVPEGSDIILRTFKHGAAIYGRYTADILTPDGRSLAGELKAAGFEKRENY